MPENFNCCKLPKIQTKMPNLRVFCQEDANGIANSEDPDQTAPRGKQSFKPLAIFCSCIALNVSDLVRNPKDRFSHDNAHNLLCTNHSYGKIVIDYIRRYRVPLSILFLVMFAELDLPAVHHDGLCSQDPLQHLVQVLAFVASPPV